MRPRARLPWALALAVLIACGAPPPAGGATVGLSVAYPITGQTLSGTVALAAAGYGGQATDLRFVVAGTTVVARADGTAHLDTRSLPDGSHTLRAEAVVAGRDVADEVVVRVDNDLADSGTVGAAGGAVRAPSGSIAALLPGALAADTTVRVRDVTQQDILDDFAVDYPALGVTFLGALEVDTGGAELGLPVAVDLAGWAQAVQPGRQVVMFALAPDADGDGVGELMFASAAEATANGSVITRAVPRSEVYGFGAAGGLATLQASGVRPGQIVTVAGRGFNPLAPLANAARYGPAAAPTAETLLDVRLADAAAFNPLLEVRFAVPALGAGNHELRLHNLTTGFRASPLTLGLLAPGSAPTSAWTGLLAQVDAAAGGLTIGRADLAALADAWRATLAAADPALPAAMAANSGLVSAANLAALQQIGAGGATAAQRDLVLRHALVLDAIASSLTGGAAAAAADLATLLAVTAHGAAVVGSSLAPLQAGDASCTGTASTGGGFSWGTPTTTGMGDGPTASCANGNAAGGDGAGASAVHHEPAALARRLDPATLATASLRRGGFRPVAGALVKVFRRGSDTPLAPFTAFTDATGTFTIPFLAPGEPFTVRAFDPVTLQVAEADGVARGVNVSTPVSLLFTTSVQGPGAPTASFVIRPVADARFAGTVYYEFDASGSSAEGSIETYVWDFGGFPVEVGWTDTVVRGYGRNGTYDVRLTVVDDEGRAGTTTRQLVIDDLPYDYWGTPPERATVGPNGEIPDQEVWGGFAISGDGRYVAFATDAGNLHPDDVNGLTDVFLKDMATGELELVSSGAAGQGTAWDVAMSADARFVAYAAYTQVGSSATNRRVEVRDRLADTVAVIPPQGGLSAIDLFGLSDDGQVVLIQSWTLNGPRHLYAVDLATDEVTRIGLHLDGVTYAEDVAPGGLSGDGDTIVFRSISGDLVPDDTNGVRDVFAFRRSTAETVRVSEAADGTQGDRASSAWGRVVTPDGRYVTFWSDATTFPRASENDGAGPFAQVEDVYVKDLATGALTLVSTNAADVLADADAILPTISDDGRYVAFGSYARNLAPEMDPYDGCTLGLCVQGFSYVKDTVTGRVALVTVGLHDALPDDWDQIEPIISGDGRRVGFYSWASNLVEGDVPDTNDYFRADNPLWVP